MGADEVGTLQALKAHRREVIDPSIATFKGRIVKTVIRPAILTPRIASSADVTLMVFRR